MSAESTKVLTVTDFGGGRIEAFGDDHLTTLGDCRSVGILMVAMTRQSLCEMVPTEKQ
jgi:hypothetical protein